MRPAKFATNGFSSTTKWSFTKHDDQAGFKKIKLCGLFFERNIDYTEKHKFPALMKFRGFLQKKSLKLNNFEVLIVLFLYTNI